MKRRAFLAVCGAGLASLGGCGPLVSAGAAPAAAGRLFIPGYATAEARIGGRPAREGLSARPEDSTLLTRVDPDGAIVQAIFPLTGHDVALSPDGRLGFFGRMGAGPRGGAHHIAFDPATLQEVGRGRPLAPGWRGGGHGVYLPDGSAVLTAERAPLAGWTGRPEAHFGRIALRDPQSLAVIDWIPCHGIDPHEMRLLPGGRQVAVANYGSVAAPGTGQGAAELGVPRQVMGACVTVVELSSGALVARHASPDPEVELRHLALSGEGAILAIRVHLGAAGRDAPWIAAGPLPEPDRTAAADEAYLPAAPLFFAPGAAPGTPCGTGAQADGMRHGLSVEHEPTAEEFLATFPSSHRLMVFDAATGRLRRQIDTAALGLPYPCGLALLPDGETYAVAGYWQDVLIFRRGSHRPLRRLTRPAPLYGHSHMTAG